MFSFYTYAQNRAVADDIEHVLDTVYLGERRIERVHYVNGCVAVIVHYRTRSVVGNQLAQDLQSYTVKLHVSGYELDLHPHPIPKSRSKKTRK